MAATESIDRLYYATGGRGKCGDDRTLHPDENCRYIQRSNRIGNCDAARPPRGKLCSFCTPDHIDSVDDFKRGESA